MFVDKEHDSKAVGMDVKRIRYSLVVACFLNNWNHSFIQILFSNLVPMVIDKYLIFGFLELDHASAFEIWCLF